MLWPLRLSLSLTTLSYWLVTSRPIHSPDALVTGVWIDPLEPPDEEVARPPTFCREKNWSEEPPTTSIDTVLVNELASRLLEHVKVTPLRGFQHAACPYLSALCGPDEVPRAMAFASFAPLDLEALCSVTEWTTLAETLWTSTCQPALDSPCCSAHPLAFFGPGALLSDCSLAAGVTS